MGIKANFTQADIQKIFDNVEDRIKAGILRAFRYTGEQFIVNARTNGAYQDKSGNLRNSVGYIILLNGQIVDENFTGEGEEGPARGKEVAASIASQYPRGYALICVAGMHYAAAVETKGYDVITGSAKQAKKDLSQALSRVLDRL